MSDQPTAVIIEDDADVRELIVAILTQSGFEAHSASNGYDGIEAVRAHDPVVTTLDVSMPGMDGFAAARRIREFSSTYLIMLTALGEEIDVVQGLDAGADDYIVKPFRPRELRARIASMQRRPHQRSDVPAAEGEPATASQSVVAGSGSGGGPVAPVDPQSAAGPSAPGDGIVEHEGLRVDTHSRTVVVDGRPIELTRSEFDLLAALLESGRRVRSKADLVLTLRNESYVTSSYVNEADKRAVSVHMANLRRKLGESSTAPRWIETVRGVGYRLTVDR